MSNELKKISKISVDKNNINNTNVRKNSLNNYDFISNKRKYYNLIKSVEKEENRLSYNNNRIDNSGTSIIQIFNYITTNPMYVKITQILKSSVDNQRVLTNRNKQLQIEETLKFLWNEELNSMFQGKKSLFSNYVGINILMSSISKLDKVLNLFKKDKRYLMNKTYRNHIILSQNGIIVSIV